MTADELFQRRHSVRAYDPSRPVSAETITAIAERLRNAPSAANFQPWRLVVVKSAERLKTLHEAYTREWFKSAPLVVAAVGSAEKAWRHPKEGWSSLRIDLSILMHEFTLIATSLGLGSCWVCNFDSEKARAACDVGEHEELLALSPLGYTPAGYVQPERGKRLAAQDLVAVL